MPERSRTFGSLTVNVVNDSIANRHADVIVNAANTQLSTGGGVASALGSRGGTEIYTEAITHAPASLGEVVRTTAGKLQARWVYHAVVIDSDVDQGTSAPDVTAAVRMVLVRARKDGIRSLAMPLFGAGIGGLKVEESLGAILEVIEEHGRHGGPQLDVEVAVLSAEDWQRAAKFLDSFEDTDARHASEDRLAADFLASLGKRPKKEEN
jgi:O-acetyl-ADP-ribose deacetylase (regulator of RNase III)